jgi:hypothetical protein
MEMKRNENAPSAKGDGIEREERSPRPPRKRGQADTKERIPLRGDGKDPF